MEAFVQSALDGYQVSTRIPHARHTRTDSCLPKPPCGAQVCLLAYGQTGSGKTHTMLGMGGEDGTNAGIIPRAISKIMRTVRHPAPLCTRASPRPHPPHTGTLVDTSKQRTPENEGRSCGVAKQSGLGYVAIGCGMCCRLLLGVDDGGHWVGVGGARDDGRDLQRGGAVPHCNALPP